LTCTTHHQRQPRRTRGQRHERTFLEEPEAFSFRRRGTAPRHLSGGGRIELAARLQPSPDGGGVDRRLGAGRGGCAVSAVADSAGCAGPRLEGFAELLCRSPPRARSRTRGPSRAKVTVSAAGLPSHPRSARSVAMGVGCWHEPAVVDRGQGGLVRYSHAPRAAARRSWLLSWRGAFSLRGVRRSVRIACRSHRW
jgi:hypothetical protein